MLAPALIASLLASIPTVGSVAPDFQVTDTEGKVHHLAELVKNENVILAFFPKAFTSGCTTEMKTYRDRYADVQKAEGHVLAVSMDDGLTLRRFKTELNAPFAFVPDPDGKLVALYDVKMPVLGMAKRYTFVIGPDRKVLRVDSGDDAVHAEKAVTACPRRSAVSNPPPPAH
jgi:peroxiredoxin